MVHTVAVWSGSGWFLTIVVNLTMPVAKMIAEAAPNAIG
jgi:hypothetical protein